ncbi:MAG TPA: hypothetical protein VEJ86_11995 [Candidatus Binataceae bacterium]|nr:hypothetical protein [Candidatus Binataceae bacterium]
MAEIHPFRPKVAEHKPTRQEIWREFCADQSLRELHRITDHELGLLARTAMLGEFHSSDDLLFMLKVIRRGNR